MKTYLDIRVEEDKSGLSLRTAYQAPAVLESGRLPFQSADGSVTIAASPTGVPHIVSRDGHTSLFLRTDTCPLPLWNRALRTPVSPKNAKQAARAVKTAVYELRRALREEETSKK